MLMLIPCSLQGNNASDGGGGMRVRAAHTQSHCPRNGLCRLLSSEHNCSHAVCITQDSACCVRSLMI